MGSTLFSRITGRTLQEIEVEIQGMLDFKTDELKTDPENSPRKFSGSLSGASDYSRAKTPRTQSDGPSPVIPNECEGSEKDFSLRSK
jgi:hypothetical protein